jgi:hypothetical protein
MAISGLQTIDVGLQNESTGSDSLYTAFNKIQDNFEIVANIANYSNFTGNTGIAVASNANAGTVGITNTGVISIIAGTNITVSSANGNVTINSAGGNGSGSVTSVGVTPVSNSRITVTNSPITTTGNISIDLANSGVTAGSYTLPSITVDNYGRVINISNGSSVGSQITNGNSNVTVSANSDITLGVNGNANVLVITGSSATLTGNLIAGNVSGTLLTGTITTDTQPNITSLGTLTYLIVSGNINTGNIAGANVVNANYFIGSGNNLSNIQAANITGTVANATYANTAGSATSAGSAGTATYASTSGSAGSAITAVTAATVTGTTQSNITSVGTLTSLIVNGNINAGNVIATSFTGSTANTTISSSANVILSANTSVQVSGGGTFRLPRLTSAQIANLIPVNGDMIYNSTLNKFQGYENSAWANLI